MICPDCGTDNAAGAEWCTRCQYRFESRRAAPPPPTPVVAAPAEEVGAQTAMALDDVEPGDEEPGATAAAAGSSEATVTAIKPEYSARTSWTTSPPAAEAAPVRKAALFPSQSQATSIDPSWVAPSDDYGSTIAEEVTRIGVTAFRFMILGAILLFLSAALPTIVYSVVNVDGTAVTGMLYMPLDVAVAVVCGVVALLGRKRNWTIIRLSAVGLILALTVAYRYLTYTSLAVSAQQSVGAQSVRLGPGWYLMVLGGAALGVTWLGAVRGRLE